MNVLVVGSGAREHALVWALARSPRIGRIVCAPGNAGIAQMAETLPLAVRDTLGILRAVEQERIDLTVVGPEEPLAHGLADQLTSAGFPVFGPTAAGARIESSKAWAKEVMAAAGVPTARAVVARSLEEVRAALEEMGTPVVLKADGLAAGKGVVICHSRQEAETTARQLLEGGLLGAAGQTLLVEEFLSGMEVSLLALTDGATVWPLLPACDYKRASDGDTGPNTGGMGAYAPPKAVDADLVEQLTETVLRPTVRELARRGIPYRGVLYAGLMLTERGPKVLEFNCRFGDPETQVVLPMLESDLLELCVAAAHGRLSSTAPPRWRAGACVGVVLASGGYPSHYETGKIIHGLDRVPPEALVFHAGTARAGDAIVTSGGRVLTCVGRGADMASARALAYAAAEVITFEGVHYRRDIALRELT